VGSGAQLQAALAAHHATTRPEAVGFLYLDGHVRVYTLDLERDLDRHEPRVEAAGRLLTAAARDQAQDVRREVAARVGADEQHRRRILEVGDESGILPHQQRRGWRDPLGADRRDALAAADLDVRLGQPRRRLQQPHEERPLAELLCRRLRVGDLDVLDPVEDTGLLDRTQAALVAARVPHGMLLANDAAARSCVRSTT